MIFFWNLNVVFNILNWINAILLIKWIHCEKVKTCSVFILVTISGTHQHQQINTQYKLIIGSKDPNSSQSNKSKPQQRQILVIIFIKLMSVYNYPQYKIMRKQWALELIPKATSASSCKLITAICTLQTYSSLGLLQRWINLIVALLPGTKASSLRSKSAFRSLSQWQSILCTVSLKMSFNYNPVPPPH